MLVQPKGLPYIGIFKTHSGEEFIGKVVDENSTEYQVKNPLTMVPTEGGLRFAPFIFMADADKAITVPKPIITGVPETKLQQQYEQAISPIQLIKR